MESSIQTCHRWNESGERKHGFTHTSCQGFGQNPCTGWVQRVLPAWHLGQFNSCGPWLLGKGHGCEFHGQAALDVKRRLLGCGVFLLLSAGQL